MASAEPRVLPARVVLSRILYLVWNNNSKFRRRVDISCFRLLYAMACGLRVAEI